jgi:hypothetical protein
MIGRTLGDYRIVEQIGMGGMATVYKAYDPTFDRFVAIKILPETSSKRPEFRERFKREAKAIARLEHPHVLPVFSYGEEDGITFLVMRYLPSGTLRDYLQENRPSLAQTSVILKQLADALDHAHGHGILHRDVKPSNVLLDDKGNAYLTDFGIAKMVEEVVELTRGDAILGTPAYMSPEQCESARDLTPASDQYSLGIVLYEMVTGRPPFEAETPLAVILQHLNDPLPPPSSLRPDLPEDVERVILKALSGERGQRWPSCSAMATAFEQAVAAAPVDFEPPIEPIPFDPEAAVPKARQLPGWALGVIGALVVAGLVGGAAALGLFRQAGDEVGPTIVAQPTDGEATELAELVESVGQEREAAIEEEPANPTITPAPPVDATQYGCQPSEKLLYAVDFEAQDPTGGFGLWTVEDGPDGGRALHAVKDGVFQLTDMPVAETRYAARVWWDGASTIELMFRWDTQNTIDYDLYIDNAGVKLLLIVSPATHELVQAPPMPANQWVSIEIIWEDGNTVVVHQDGAEVIRKVLTGDAFLEEGHIALGARGGTDVWFDDIAVCGA